MIASGVEFAPVPLTLYASMELRHSDVHVRSPQDRLIARILNTVQATERRLYNLFYRELRNAEMSADDPTLEIPRMTVDWPHRMLHLPPTKRPNVKTKSLTFADSAESKHEKPVGVPCGLRLPE
jgi:hypothetical protein